MEHYKKKEKSNVPCETPLGLLPGTRGSWASPLALKLGGGALSASVRTVLSFGSLEFSQASTFSVTLRC